MRFMYKRSHVFNGLLLVFGVYHFFDPLGHPWVHSVHPSLSCLLIHLFRKDHHSQRLRWLSRYSFLAWLLVHPFGKDHTRWLSGFYWLFLVAGLLIHLFRKDPTRGLSSFYWFCLGSFKDWDLWGLCNAHRSKTLIALFGFVEDAFLIQLVKADFFND